MGDLDNLRLGCRLVGSAVFRRVLILLYSLCFYGAFLFLLLRPEDLPPGFDLKKFFSLHVFPWVFLGHGMILRLLYAGGLRFWCFSNLAAVGIPVALCFDGTLTDAITEAMSIAAASSISLAAGMFLVVCLRTLALFLYSLRRS